MTIADTLFGQVASFGKPEEKQLVGRWQKELSEFMNTFTAGLIKGRYGMNLGLSKDLSLTLLIKQHDQRPFPGTLNLIDDQDSLISKAYLHAITHSMNAHIGICVNSLQKSLLLYIHSSPGSDTIALETLLGIPALPDAMKAHMYCVDDSGNVSAICFSSNNPPLQDQHQRLLQQQEDLLHQKLDKHSNTYWQQYVLTKQTGWKDAEAGMEIEQPPLALTTRIVSHYSRKLRYFRYLIPITDKRNFVLKFVDREITGWYFPLQ